MGEQAELVNLGNDDALRRPAKRLRQERFQPQVFDLVDSDEDAAIPGSGLANGATQDVDRNQVHHRAGALWGALGDQHAGAPGAVERPLYRPPSARFRRLPLPAQPRPNNVTSPIVIDDEDEESARLTSPQLGPPLRRLSTALRQHFEGRDAASADPQGAPEPLMQRLLARGLNLGSQGTAAAEAAAAAAAAAAPANAAAAATDGLPRNPQQAPHAEQPQRQPHLQNPLSRIRRMPLPEPNNRMPSLGDGGSLNSSVAAAAAAAAAAGSGGGGAAARWGSSLLQPRPRSAVAQGLEALHRRELDGDFRQVRLQRMHEQRQQREQQREERQREQQQREQPQELGQQEDEDLRLALQLQQEEDERAAQEAARRLEVDERLAREEDNDVHRRLVSRLNALQTLEESSQLAAAVAAAARAANGGRGAGRRTTRTAERAPGRGAGRNLEQEFMDMSMLRAARAGRGAGGPMPGLAMFGGPGDDESEELAAEAAAAAADAGGGRARWAAQAFHDMLFPGMAMAVGMPYGLQRAMGGRGGEEAAGRDQHRRMRHAAYREHMMAMREQVLAAQRTGLPPSLLLSDRDFTPEDYEMLCRLDEKVENRKGAREEQVAALPSQVVGAGGRRQSNGAPATCVICMEELAPGEVLKRLPCAHEFHGGCVETWLKTKAACPVCQRGLED